MRIGPDGRLYVTQAMGSQISAIDLATGVCEVVAPHGGSVLSPDDLVFGDDRTIYATEPYNNSVAALAPDGSVRRFEGLPRANGITRHRNRIYVDESRPGGRVLELFPDGAPPRVIAEDLVHPNALAVGRDGLLYFPQVRSGLVSRVDPEGGRVETVLEGLAMPVAVEANKDGELFVAELVGGTVRRVDPEAHTADVVATPGRGLDNLVFDQRGQMIVSHMFSGQVTALRLSPEANDRILAPGGFLGPWGIDVAPDGAILVADGPTAARTEHDGTVARIALIYEPDFPARSLLRAVAVAPDGAVALAAGAGGVVVLERGRARLVGEGLGELCDLAWRGSDELMASTSEGRVVVVDRASSATRTVASGLSDPTGIAVTADGQVAVAEAGAGRLSMLGSDSARVLVDGLREPHGVACSGESVFVLDAGSRELWGVGSQGGDPHRISWDLPVGGHGTLPPDLPVQPFSGLAVTAEGALVVGADGTGQLLTLHRLS
jgi:streptogramin lyase